MNDETLSQRFDRHVAENLAAERKQIEARLAERDQIDLEEFQAVRRTRRLDPIYKR